jgi:hypothetical protein
MASLLLGACAAPQAQLVACPPEGCAALDPPDELHTRAAFDLQCPARQLELFELSDRSWDTGVRGCGRQAVYKMIRGVWTLDSPIQPLQKPTPLKPAPDSQVSI